MSLHVDPIEAFWIALNGTTLVLTIAAWLEARRDRALVTIGENVHPARLLTADGNVRREALRTIIQLLLLSIAIPSLFTENAIVLTPPLIALLLVPVVLFFQTYLDRRLRGEISEVLVAEVRVERDALAKEASVQEAIAAAHRAYEEANNANVKIATLTEIVAGKEDKA